MTSLASLPRVLPMRQRAEVVYRLLKRRSVEVMPGAMRGAGIDCWLILCCRRTIWILFIRR